MKSRRLSYKNVLAILFSVVVFVFFFTICERVFRYSVLHQIPATVAAENEEENEQAYSFTEMFPFADGAAPASTDSTKTVDLQSWEAYPTLTLRQKIVFWNTYFHINVSYFTEKYLIARMQFINLHAKFSKCIGMKMISDTDSNVITLTNGALNIQNAPYDPTPVASRIADFAKDLQKNGTDFLFVQVPTKVDPDNSTLPPGFEDTDNVAADTALQVLRQQGVPCLDIRDLMREQGIDFSDAFYITDHHWTINTAFWATKEIAAAASQVSRVQFDTDKFDILQYTEKTFAQFSLGSIGKKVSAAYIDPEDFSVLLPKYATDFTLHNYLVETKRGAFDEVLVNMHVFDKKDLYNVSAYGAYMYGTSPYVTVENHNAVNDSNVLLIGDSFSKSVAPYLASGVKTLSCLNAMSFNGSVKTLVQKTEPDIVIVMFYAPSYLNGGNSIRFE